MHRPALAIREKAFGADHPKVIESLQYLGTLFYSQGKLAEAKPFFKRALVIANNTLGANDSWVSTSLNFLGKHMADHPDTEQEGKAL